MTQDDIIRMAREAGINGIAALWGDGHEVLARFAQLVAAHEREECAKVCDSHAEAESVPNAPTWSGACAEAIRARGNT